MRYIDDLIDSITMYRLVVYILGIYIGFATMFAFMGRLPFSPTEMVISLGLIIMPALIVDKTAARILRTTTNSESWLITSLILFLIIAPAHSLGTGLALVLAGGLSSASKFLFAWHGRHIFNPAAFAAAFLSLTDLHPATWWIGGSLFWPLTLILGLAVLRKIRRIPLWLTFAVVAVGLQASLFLLDLHTLDHVMKSALIASPFIFLSTIMLTEPATMPARRSQQMAFAVLVAVLYVTGWKVGPLTIFPEVALLIGNLYAFAVSPKFRVRLQLQEVQRISDRVYNYVFRPDKRFAFQPGQYMEWTLPGVPYDARGNRRTFTIASSPTEDTVQLGVKFYEPASMFKMKLASMRPGDEIYGSQLAGNFTIDPHSSEKLALIAGGIGITPFRSIIKYLTDKRIARDIVLVYVVSDVTELAYWREFREASRIGLRVVPVVTNIRTQQIKGVVQAQLDAHLLAELVKDYDERTFYISGPSVMVDATRGYLTQLEVPIHRIRTDHFSGY